MYLNIYRKVYAPDDFLRFFFFSNYMEIIDIKKIIVNFV